jgi:nifR3 family TIM-barrel protein
MGKKVFGSGEFERPGPTLAQVDPDLVRPLTVGGRPLPTNLVLAPMAGVSNLPFRLIAREAGAAVGFTETVSAKGLVMGGAKTRRLLASNPREALVAFQLFGADPQVLAEACRILVGEHGAEWIDLNLGCPVKKFIRNGAGSALLREPERVREIARAMRAAMSGIFSVKIRTGWDAHSVNAPEIARILAGEGVNLISVHGRTRTQQYTGTADRGVIRRVVEAVPEVPVLANGDVTLPGDVFDMLRETSAAGVMIGRGAMGNPWIFAQACALARGEDLKLPSAAERWSTVQRHVDLMRGCFDDPILLANNLKKYVTAYAKGLPASARFRRSVLDAGDLDTILALTDGFFSPHAEAA